MRRLLSSAAAAAALFGVGAGGRTVLESSPASTSTTTEIIACRQELTGLIRVVAHPGQCAPLLEAVVRWNAAGPAGPPGAAGSQGPAGPQGEPGPPGSEAGTGDWLSDCLLAGVMSPAECADQELRTR